MEAVYAIGALVAVLAGTYAVGAGAVVPAASAGRDQHQAEKQGHRRTDPEVASHVEFS